MKPPRNPILAMIVIVVVAVAANIGLAALHGWGPDPWWQTPLSVIVFVPLFLWAWNRAPPTEDPHQAMTSTVLKHPSAFLPVVMSLGALATVLGFLAVHGPAPQADEGAAAHIWQLLMAAQLPIVLFFAFKWVPRSPRQAVPILVLQIGSALAAIAPVLLLRW